MSLTSEELVRSRIEGLADTLIDVSHSIWDHPELCFEEHHAHDLLCDVLEAEGVPVTRHAYGLDTAFVAEVGDEGPTVAVCLEYDALPDVGHACGHNIIAAAGLGAGLAAAAAAVEAGGRVRILGTPAEEGGGGKVFMIREGAFDDVDAAMMVHPASHDLPSLTTLAIQRCEATYTGRASHAAAAPEQGRNALDAAVLGYTNVAALRQHIASDERIHGVFTDGGGKPNVVPPSAATSWYVRSPTPEGLAALKTRFEACLEAGALAAGCSMELEWLDPPYSNLIDDTRLLGLYAQHSAALGRPLLDPDEVGHVVGSTDMGDVSHVVPTIHPLLAVAPPGTAIHTPSFAEHARSESGDRAVLDGATAMALTILDIWRSGGGEVPGNPAGSP